MKAKEYRSIKNIVISGGRKPRKNSVMGILNRMGCIEEKVFNFLKPLIINLKIERLHLEIKHSVHKWNMLLTDKLDNIIMTFKNLRTKTKATLIVQVVGMLMGTYTHLVWILKNGFLSENYNAPLMSKLFWDSLTFLDPIAAVLLIFKPKTGVYLTLAIILLDIIHNNLFYMDELYWNAPKLSEWIVRYWIILGQIVFGLFVILTFKSNLKEIKNKTLPNKS